MSFCLLSFRLLWCTLCPSLYSKEFPLVPRTTVHPRVSLATPYTLNPALTSDYTSSEPPGNKKKNHTSLLKQGSVWRWFNPVISVPLLAGERTPASEDNCFTKTDSSSHLLTYQMGFGSRNRAPYSADSVQHQPCMYTNVQWESYTECPVYTTFTSSREVGGASYSPPELSQDVYPQYTCEAGVQSHCLMADYALYSEQEQSHSVSSRVGW